MKKGRKKILRIIARLNVGGPAIQAINLTRDLNNDEFESLLVHGLVSEGEEDITTFPGMNIQNSIVLPGLGRELHPVKDIKTVIELVKIIRCERPEIIHTHTAKAGAVGRVAGALCGVPSRVHTFHGHVFHGYFSPLKTAFFKFIEKVLVSFTSRIVTISPLQKNEIQNILGVPSSKITVIPLGFDLGRFAKCTENDSGEFRSAIGAGPEDLVITIVGRITAIKNHGVFIEAAKQLCEKRNNLKFAIVGGGDLQNEYEQKVKDLGLVDKVIFAGWWSSVEKVYAGSDVVALTSDNEGTPVCLIEALSSGVPVVSTDVGGVGDVVKDGETGFLVPVGDDGAVAAGIEKLLTDPKLRKKMGSSGAVDMQSRYSHQRLLGDIVSLYRTL